MAERPINYSFHDLNLPDLIKKRRSLISQNQSRKFKKLDEISELINKLNIKIAVGITSHNLAGQKGQERSKTHSELLVDELKQYESIKNEYDVAFQELQDSVNNVEITQPDLAILCQKVSSLNDYFSNLYQRIQRKKIT